MLVNLVGLLTAAGVSDSFGKANLIAPVAATPKPDPQADEAVKGVP